MEKGLSSRVGGSGAAFGSPQFGRKIYFDDASGGESSSKPVTAPALPKMRQLVAGRKAAGGGAGMWAVATSAEMPGGRVQFGSERDKILLLQAYGLWNAFEVS